MPAEEEWIAKDGDEEQQRRENNPSRIREPKNRTSSLGTQTGGMF